MPQNKVVERMAKREYDYQKKISDDHHVWVDKRFWGSTPWERVSDKGKEPYRQLALRQLGVVDSRTYGETSMDGEKIVACEDDLVEAFDMARKVREKEKVNARKEIESSGIH